MNLPVEPSNWDYFQPLLARNTSSETTLAQHISRHYHVLDLFVSLVVLCCSTKALTHDRMLESI